MDSSVVARSGHLQHDARRGEGQRVGRTPFARLLDCALKLGEGET